MKIKRTEGEGKKQLDRLLSELNNKVGKVGWFPSAKYPDGTPVAYVAAIQEYGSVKKGIPPRSFMRVTVEKQKVFWQNLLRYYVKKALKDNTPLVDAMELLTLKAASDIQTTISKITTPPLSLVTLILRKRRKQGKSTTGENLWGAFKLAKTLKGGRKSPSLSGVSTKPLVDTRYLINTLTGAVEDK